MPLKIHNKKKEGISLPHNVKLNYLYYHLNKPQPTDHPIVTDGLF
jgi:hypothetical protein